MKTILSVIDHPEYTDSLLEKSLRLKPEKLKLLILTGSDDESLAIRQNIDVFFGKDLACKPQLSIEQGSVSSSQEAIAVITQQASQASADIVVLKKPKAIGEKQKLSLIKKLLKETPAIKLLLVRKKKWKTQAKILCTVDIKSRSKSQRDLDAYIFKYVCEMLQPALSAKLSLASVIQVSRLAIEFSVIEPIEVLFSNRKKYLNKLRKFKQSICSGDVSFYIDAGIVSRKIPKLSKELRVDLVVMGNVGRTGIKGLLIGNTAQTILRNLTSDVLICGNPKE